MRQFPSKFGGSCLAWKLRCFNNAQRRFRVSQRRAFRVVSLFVIMAALLLLYRVHPIAGWATLTMLALGTVVARRRKVKPAVAK